jgi:hypothetical protein
MSAKHRCNRDGSPKGCFGRRHFQNCAVGNDAVLQVAPQGDEQLAARATMMIFLIRPPPIAPTCARNHTLLLSFPTLVRVRCRHSRTASRQRQRQRIRRARAAGLQNALSHLRADVSPLAAGTLMFGVHL